MKNIKTTTLILFLVLVSLLSKAFAQKDVIHFKTAHNKFGRYDESADTSIYDIFNDSEVDVYLTKNNIFLVDTGRGVMKFSSLEFVKKCVIDDNEYIYLKAEDQSDPNNIRIISFGMAFDKYKNGVVIFLTD